MRFRFPALVAILLMGGVAQAAEFVGVPRVVDGDTLEIGAVKVRLQGIDAPETDQICLNASGDHWTCGIDARDRLAAHIAGHEIRCVSNGTDVAIDLLSSDRLPDLPRLKDASEHEAEHTRYNGRYFAGSVPPTSCCAGINPNHMDEESLSLTVSFERLAEFSRRHPLPNHAAPATRSARFGPLIRADSAVAMQVGLAVDVGPKR